MRYYIRYISGNKTLFWHGKLGWVAPGRTEDVMACTFVAEDAMMICERNFKALRLEAPNGSFELSLVLHLT